MMNLLLRVGERYIVLFAECCCNNDAVACLGLVMHYLALLYSQRCVLCGEHRGYVAP